MHHWAIRIEFLLLSSQRAYQHSTQFAYLTLLQGHFLKLTMSNSTIPPFLTTTSGKSDDDECFPLAYQMETVEMRLGGVWMGIAVLFGLLIGSGISLAAVRFYFKKRWGLRASWSHLAINSNRKEIVLHCRMKMKLGLHLVSLRNLQIVVGFSAVAVVHREPNERQQLILNHLPTALSHIFSKILGDWCNHSRWEKPKNSSQPWRKHTVRLCEVRFCWSRVGCQQTCRHPRNDRQKDVNSLAYWTRDCWYPHAADTVNSRFPLKKKTFFLWKYH